MLDHLVGLPAAFVWGNCDDRKALEQYAALLEVTCCGAVGEFVLGGKHLAVLHGDDAPTKHKLIALQQYDYILQGHTHMAEDRRIGRTRLINPGALQRARPRTAALLDLRTDALEILTVTTG